ncbi:MAG: DUF3094 family protein [Pseudomonadota bacterium]
MNTSKEKPDGSASDAAESAGSNDSYEMSSAEDIDTGTGPAKARPSQDEQPPALYPEDQQKVDEFLKRGVNSVERKPFRPLLLMIVLVVVVSTLSLVSKLIARLEGVY